MDNGNGELALVKILRIQDRKLSSLLEWPNVEIKDFCTIRIRSDHCIV